MFITLEKALKLIPRFKLLNNKPIIKIGNCSSPQISIESSRDIWWLNKHINYFKYENLLICSRTCYLFTLTYE